MKSVIFGWKLSPAGNTRKAHTTPYARSITNSIPNPYTVFPYFVRAPHSGSCHVSQLNFFNFPLPGIAVTRSPNSSATRVTTARNSADTGPARASDSP